MSSAALHPTAQPAHARRSHAPPSQPMDMLVRIARQSQLGDAEGCATLLTMLASMRLLRLHLQRVLAPLKLSEVKLATLISLYALDPVPSSASDLAYHAQVSRATMTDTLELMRAHGWVARERSSEDRRKMRVMLTTAGRELVEQAVRPFLAALGRCSEFINPRERDTILHACARLDAHLQA